MHLMLLHHFSTVKFHIIHMGSRQRASAQKIWRETLRRFPFRRPHQAGKIFVLRPPHGYRRLFSEIFHPQIAQKTADEKAINRLLLGALSAGLLPLIVLRKSEQSADA
jgi:hypothetical protein